jgi:hypothetical protein
MAKSPRVGFDLFWLNQILQLKTAKCCKKDDTAQVLRTIDPNLWFSEAKTKKADFAEEMDKWQSPKQLQILTILFTTSASCRNYFKFDCDDSKAQIILCAVLDKIAKDNKKLSTQEEGTRIVAEVHKEETNRLWRERGTTAPDSRPPKRQRTDEPPPERRRSFHFAVLDRRHTRQFFGQDVEILISAIKGLKPEEESHDDVEMTDVA